jgi:hypothetical protein
MRDCRFWFIILYKMKDFLDYSKQVDGRIYDS